MPKKIKRYSLPNRTGQNGGQWLLTAIEAKKRGISVHYESVEAFPLPKDIWHELQVPIQSDLSIDELHHAPWDSPVKLTDHFELIKRQSRLEALSPSLQFDLIYYDAFSPKTQPELWSEGMLKTKWLKPRFLPVWKFCKYHHGIWTPLFLH